VNHYGGKQVIVTLYLGWIIDWSTSRIPNEI